MKAEICFLVVNQVEGAVVKPVGWGGSQPEIALYFFIWLASHL